MKKNLAPPNNKQVILDTIPLGYLLLDNYSELGDEKIREFADHKITEEKSNRFMATLRQNDWLTTAQILTEVSNHIEKDTSNVSKLEEFFDTNHDFIQNGFNEYALKKSKFLGTNFNKGLGIADCSIYELCQTCQNPVVILDDKKLKGELKGRDIEVFPFSSVINIGL